jgi:pimeloyl-ACP methyl ester carboxylesterase
MSTKLRGVVKTRRITAAALAILSAWVISSPRFLPGLYTSKLFHPNTDRGSAQQVAELKAFREVPNHEVFFNAQDGSRLHGWLFLQPGATKIYVLFPGNAGDIPRRLDYFKMLLASGASVFTYEPRGFGQSQGKPSIISICQDGENAYDYVSKTLGYSSEQIVLYGVSLGTTVATHVSTVRTACGLILQSGFSSLEDIAYEMVPFVRIYPAFLFPQSPALDNVAIVRQLHVPLLVMHGAMDSLINIKHSRRIFDQASAPKTLVACPHSGHVNIDPQDVPLFINSLRQFLQTLK